MRQRRTGLRIAGALALGLTVAAASPQAAPAKEAAEPDKPVVIRSLSGAYLAARTAEADNDLDAAITYFERALSFDPDNQTIQQSLMLALIAVGRFDEALDYAEPLKSVADVERYSRLALGVDAIRAKQYGKARNWLMLAAGSDLDMLITGILTGWAMHGEGDSEEAIVHLESLTGPAWYDLFVNFHTALIADLAGMEDAGDRYRQVFDDRASAGAAPDTWFRSIEAYVSWLARKSRNTEALNVLDQAEEVSPGRATLVALRARINAGKAVRPLVANPSDGGAELLLNLGTALNRGGGETFVRLYLQYGRALKPDSDAILTQLGAIFEQMGKSEEAIAFYEAVPVASPMKRVAELQLGLNLADLDRHEEAIVHLKAVIEQDVDDMRAYLALGGVYASMEDYASAATLYDRAVTRISNPGRAEWNIFYQRGIAYERIKQWEKAEPNFQKALELYPDHPQVLNYLGYSWVDMNINLEEGLAMIRKAVDQRPRDGYIVDSLGWAYYRLGRYEEAVVELERAVQLRPEDPVINDHLGDAYWKTGRLLEATFQWGHALDLNPDEALRVTIEKKLSEGLPDGDNGNIAAPGEEAQDDDKS